VTSPASKQPPQRPFKKLFCHWRGRLFVDLKGARLAVWLYHYLRSNKEDQAWPSIAGVARGTGLHRDTVIEARKYLFAHGWLVKIENTGFKTRRVMATFPGCQSEIPTSDGKVGNSDSTSGQSEIPDAGKFRHEVDSSSKVEKQKRYDTALHAAVSAFRLFQQDEDDETALNLLRWIIYRAAHPSSGKPGEIPQSINYYTEARDNFKSQHEYGSENVLDNTEDRFETYARDFLAEKNPQLLAWLDNLSDPW